MKNKFGLYDLEKTLDRILEQSIRINKHLTISDHYVHNKRLKENKKAADLTPARG